MRFTPDSKRQDVKVVGGNVYGRYQKISSEQTFNMFVSDNWLVNTAGYQRIYEILSMSTNGAPPAQGRGIFTSVRGNLLIAVIGSQVYALNENLSPSLVGSLATQSGEVFMDENLNSQICIVDGVNAYIYNYSLGYANLTIQTGLGTLIPGYVCFHNTYFLFGNADRTANGSAWYAYQYNTSTTIIAATPGQFALQTKPDYAIAVLRIPGQSSNVLVFGSSVCEVWTQIGGLQNYRRQSTINVDYGCISTSTIVTSDQYVIWLAVNENNAPIIMVYTGQGFEPVSTDGIDYQLSQIQYPSQSTAMSYRQDGHLFYQLTFYNTVDNVTILYDLSTKTFFTLTDAALNYHPAREFAYFKDNLYFISLNNGSLYQSSTNFTTYNENLPTVVQDPELNLEIPRVRICETIRSQDSSQFRVSTFSFIIEQGTDPNITGISIADTADYTITQPDFAPPDAIIYTQYGLPIVDQDSVSITPPGGIVYRPRVDVTVSRDGGITWSNYVSRNLNVLGYRQNILNWDKIGMCNSLTIKIKFFGTYRFMAYGGFAEIY